jgi:RNA polymerase sigma factor (sigma-70 family)
MEREAAPATATKDRFEALFVAYYPRVVAIARRVLQDGHLAEDVAQDVFAAFYRGAKAQDPAHAARWLHAAAVHTALNVLRGNRRRTVREAQDSHAHAVLHDSLAQAANPEHVVATREHRAEVRAALKRLPPKYAAVLVLRHAGLSYAEIAAALDTGVNQIGTLLARAEAAFKKEITRESR